MKILITGGSGFIGSHIAKELYCNLNQEVAIVDIKAPENEHYNLYYSIDIRNFDELNNAFSEFKPDICIHCAAQISVQKSIYNPSYDADVNIIGGINVINLSNIHCNTGFIFSSSGGGVYGNVQHNKAEITSATNPNNPYAQHKLVFERIIKANKNLSSIILRYSNVYGQGQKQESEAGVVSVFVENIKNNKPITIFGRSNIRDFGCIRDYIHVSDIVKSNIWAINELKNIPNAKILNCCTGVGTSTADLACIIYKAFGKRPEFNFAEPRPGDVERSVLDETEFYAKVGVPKDLISGIEETIKC